MQWKILNQLKKSIVETLLENRGLTTKKAKDDFFNLQDPEEIALKSVGLSPSSMAKANIRIKKAIKSKEKIIVYGDYDADGITATALVWETLHSLGAVVTPFIPTREDGYGMKVDRVEEFKKTGVSLIITVDQGIVQHQQILHAQKIGIETIITDHHILGKTKPKALVILHTTKLAGVGVAWFFCRELLKFFKEERKVALDLVALGTITDMTPLVGANRTLVAYGLKELQKTKRIGLQVLYEVVGLDKNNLGTFEVGYMLGPRINASGRIDDPMDPLRLLCLKKDLGRAREIAVKLDQNNRERQQLTESTTVQARAIWLASEEKGNLIFVHDTAFNEGIIGLVAQKLTEEFYLPSVVITKGVTESRASARSIEEFNIIEAIRSCSDLLGPHGGHPMAAGFNFETEKLTLIKTRLQEIADKALSTQELAPSLTVDMEISFNDIDAKLYQSLEKFAPFGIGNRTPVFVTRQVTVSDVRLVGSDKKHLKLTLQDEAGQTFEAIGFGLGKYYPTVHTAKKIDVAYNITVNEWNGRKSLQLKIKDLKT